MLIYFLRISFFLSFQREGKEKERERSLIVWLPLTCPLMGTWPATQACALDWDSNQWPFGSQAGTQSTDPHQPGLQMLIFCFSVFVSIFEHGIPCVFILLVGGTNKNKYSALQMGGVSSGTEGRDIWSGGGVWLYLLVTFILLGTLSGHHHQWVH